MFELLLIFNSSKVVTTVIQPTSKSENLTIFIFFFVASDTVSELTVSVMIIQANVSIFSEFSNKCFTLSSLSHRTWDIPTEMEEMFLYIIY